LTKKVHKQLKSNHGLPVASCESWSVSRKRRPKRRRFI